MVISKPNPKVSQIITTVFLCFFIFIVTGCASSHKVNLKLLEESKNKTFKVGVVKAAIRGGDVAPFGLGPQFIEKKKEALARIPIDNICAILNERYSLKIDSNVDRTPKIVTELSPGTPDLPRSGVSVAPRSTTENAYYGNLEYENPGRAHLMFAGNTKIARNIEALDVINVIYWMKSAPFKIQFLYAINVQSSGEDIIEYRGIVASIPDQHGWFGTLKSGGWDAYIEYAGQIHEALKRDVAETLKN